MVVVVVALELWPLELSRVVVPDDDDDDEVLNWMLQVAP